MKRIYLLIFLILFSFNCCYASEFDIFVTPSQLIEFLNKRKTSKHQLCDCLFMIKVDNAIFPYHYISIEYGMLTINHDGKKIKLPIDSVEIYPAKINGKLFFSHGIYLKINKHNIVRIRELRDHDKLDKTFWEKLYKIYINK